MLSISCLDAFQDVRGAALFSSFYQKLQAECFVYLGCGLLRYLSSEHLDSFNFWSTSGEHYGDQWLQQMIPPPPQKCLTICIWSIIAPSSCNMLVWFWQLYGSHCVKEMEVNCSILLIANDECKPSVGEYGLYSLVAGDRWRRCQWPLMNQASTNRRTSTPQGSKVHA